MCAVTIPLAFLVDPKQKAMVPESASTQIPKNLRGSSVNSRVARTSERSAVASPSATDLSSQGGMSSSHVVATRDRGDPMECSAIHLPN